MRTNQIYIARDGKSGMHVLVRILAVDDIGVDYPPIDPDNFNKLMMARDVKSLVLAARDLGPMYISADILSRRTFIPSHLQQDIECGFNLIPPDLESLLSECYFDPYALPVETDDMAIGRSAERERSRHESLSTSLTSPKPEICPIWTRSFAQSSSRCMTGSLRETSFRSSYASADYTDPVPIPTLFWKPHGSVK